jgi:hypothetical protein
MSGYCPAAAQDKRGDDGGHDPREESQSSRKHAFDDRTDHDAKLGWNVASFNGVLT